MKTTIMSGSDNMATVTAKKIAELLGVSPAAVSIALNGKSGISDSTRRDILAAAEKMGYNPGKLNTLKNQHKRLCFIFYVNELVSIAENTTFSSFVLKGAESAASALGYSINVRYFRAGEPFIDQLGDQLDDIDAVILLGTDITPKCKSEVSAFLRLIDDKPLVIIDSYENFGTADCVCNDNYGGGLQAGRYLIERGCRSIGYIRSLQRMDFFRQREAGLMTALGEAGLPLDAAIDTEVSFDEAYKCFDSFLSTAKQVPEGFFAENDIIAAAAIRALNAHGIKVPEQVSIIGFDDIPICELTAPSLTTVHSFKEQLGEAAVTLLSEKFMSLQDSSGDEKGCITLSVSTKLHIRGSVK